MTKIISSEDTNLLSDAIVSPLSANSLPFKANQNSKDFTEFYSVKLEVGHPILYLAKDKDNPAEISAFYPNGKMWGGVTRSFKEAIKGAVAEAIYYCW
jgi:hypothetical protein